MSHKRSLVLFFLLSIFSLHSSDAQDSCLERCRTFRRFAWLDCKRAKDAGLKCFLQKCSNGYREDDGWICTATIPSPAPPAFGTGCTNRCRQYRNVARSDCQASKNRGNNCVVSRCTINNQSPGWICTEPTMSPSPTPSSSRTPPELTSCPSMCRRRFKNAKRECVAAKASGLKCYTSRCFQASRRKGWTCSEFPPPSATPTISNTPKTSPTASSSISNTASPSLTASSSPSVSAKTSSPTTPSPSSTASPTISETISASASSSASHSLSVSPTPSTSASASSSLSVYPSASKIPPSSTVPLPVQPVPQPSSSASTTVTPSSSATFSMSMTPSPSISTTVTVTVSASISVKASMGMVASHSISPTASASPSSSTSVGGSITSVESSSPSVSATLSGTSSVLASVTTSETPSSTTSVTPSATTIGTLSVTSAASTSVTPTFSMTASPTVSPSASPLPPGISLDSHSPLSFNANWPLIFSPVRTSFSTDPNDAQLYTNGTLAHTSTLTLSATSLTATVSLLNGANNITLRIFSQGMAQLLELYEVIWVGNSALTVNLVGEGGAPFTVDTTVEAALSDNLTVKAVGLTTNGTVTFSNLPSRMIIFSASSANNDEGFGAALGTAGTVVIDMVGFNEPSTVDNNNFTSGLAGWEVPNSAAASIIEHVEDVGPGAGSSTSDTSTTSSDSSPRERGVGRRFEVRQRAKSEMHVRLAREDQTKAAILKFSSKQLDDNDLSVTTTVEGEQFVERTFKSTFLKTGIRVRYRFVTAEIPGGYFGSVYNDYFSVSIRTLHAGGSISEAASMNGLGLEAFNKATGSTAWRETILPLKVLGDTIEVRAVVANVQDGLYDSQVIVDFVEEVSCLKGEKPNQILGVGPIDAKVALGNSQDAIEATFATGLEGLHNGPADAFRHCNWNCRMALSIGPDQAKTVSDIHEECGDNDPSEIEMDLMNNQVGVNYGTQKDADCDQLCLDGVSNGDLQLSP